ncbi:chromate transporter [Melghirimyces profundicolus]|uniref:Chromate transporter n=1 Tax=Melghirimyces profundicolus TaxID=1242148 RepID=A0A2T6BQR3_9BACL|nr:chromate efflux transporter [Melghirimyces profundicolus]PTX58425.1 chromate transporter [Melghirimyces profundicolus]
MDKHNQNTTSNQHSPSRGSVWEVLGVATRLGLTSFGGPIAHLGYFRDEYVQRRRWLDEKTYADLVGLCQFLPGPASSQVGISIGLLRAGLPGAIASWFGFTMPSVLLLVLFSWFFAGTDIEKAGWLHGLMVVAVAIVAQAVWGMAKSLAPDPPRGTVALLAAIAALAFPTAGTQVAIIILAGLIGWRLLPRKEPEDTIPITLSVSRRSAVLSLVLFAVLLLGLPLLAQVTKSQWIAIADGFYRTGALVFGGGHVVLPLLQSVVVPHGWVSGESFLAGYGAAQAVPGPLFTFASYLGTAAAGLSGAALATLAIFLPSFFLVIGALPFWQYIRRRTAFQAAFAGVNAAVVGILLAALYDPVFTKAIKGPFDFALALIAFGLLMVWKMPPWIVVAVTALGGWVLEVFS